MFTTSSFPNFFLFFKLEKSGVRDNKTIYLIFTIDKKFDKFLKFVKLRIVKCLPPKSQNKMP